MLFARHADRLKPSRKSASPHSRVNSSPDESALRQSVFASLSLKNGVLTIKPVGPKISEREATIIADQVTSAFKSISSLRVAVIDLSCVQMMTSFGLGLSINVSNHAREFDARAVLFGMCPQLNDLFRMMKVDRLFTIVQDSNELTTALAA